MTFIFVDNSSSKSTVICFWLVVAFKLIFIFWHSDTQVTQSQFNRLLAGHILQISSHQIKNAMIKILPTKVVDLKIKLLFDKLPINVLLGSFNRLNEVEESFE